MAHVIIGTALIGAGLLGGTALVWFARRLTVLRWRRAASWLIVAVLTIYGLVISQEWGPWARLMAVWCMTLSSCKGLVLLNQPERVLEGLVGWRYWLFMLGWLGMETGAWQEERQAPRLAGWRWLLTTGLGWFALGGLMALGFSAALTSWLPPLWRMWCIWVGGVIGLFFGMTRTWGGLWRLAGRPVELLFDRPVYARSLSDWWGQRWNRPVHRVFTIAIWEPLRRVIGAQAALGAVFVASGLMHELLLSYPASGGWGLPMAYFIVQIVGMALERVKRVRRWLKPRPLAQAVWSLGWALIPAPLLFHPPLLERMVGGWLR